MPPSAVEPATSIKPAIRGDASENAPREAHWLLCIIQQESSYEVQNSFILDPEIKPVLGKACVDDA